MRGDRDPPTMVHSIRKVPQILLLAQGSGQGPLRQQGKEGGTVQRPDGGRMRAKAAANAAQLAKRPASSGLGGAAATQQLSQEDLKSVASLVAMIRENAADKDGSVSMAPQLFVSSPPGYNHLTPVVRQKLLYPGGLKQKCETSCWFSLGVRCASTYSHRQAVLIMALQGRITVRRRRGRMAHDASGSC